MAKLTKNVKDSILCGPIPELRSWQTIPEGQLSHGEKVLRFAADYLVFGEGLKIGEPLVLDPWQQAWVIASFDDDSHIHKAILSVARRAGKSLLMSVILLYLLLVKREDGGAPNNSLLRSAAMTREQAGLLFRLMAQILDMSPAIIEGQHYRTVPSSKMIVSLRKGCDYRALSRDAKSGHGQGLYALCVDEAGQIDAPNDDFLSMLFSSMGTYDDSKTFIISTQAPSDAAFLSVELDTAKRDKPKGVVAHLYTAASDEIMSKRNWNQANPSLKGGYRSLSDIERNAQDADRIPAKRSGFENLFLNRRVDREGRWLASDVWKQGIGELDWSVFEDKGVHIGLDLSQKLDLTCAVLAAADDDGVVHCHCFAFTPEHGLMERERRDKVPYSVFRESGSLIVVPGETISYDWVAQYLKLHIEDEGIAVNSIEFDRWRIDAWKQSCERMGFAQDYQTTWNEVGQGYQSMTVRIEAMETALLQRKLRYNSPILNMGAAAAIVQSDPAGNRKIVRKPGAGPKIDGVIAMLMAIYSLVGVNDEESFEADAMIG